MRSQLLSAAVVLTTCAVGCSSQIDIDPSSHAADVGAWRQYRYDLLHEEGWLLLTGLHWLEEGNNTVGSSPGNDVVFRGTNLPANIGTITIADSQVTMDIADNVPVKRLGNLVRRVVMETGSQASATVLTLGSLNWHVVRRNNLYAVRVRDSLAPSLVGFDSIPAYPLNAAWRLNARFERYDPPKPILVPSILGNVNESQSPGAVVFRLGLKRYRLDVLGQPGDSTFWIQFGDQTNGTETYGGGRYLWVAAPDQDGNTVIDFNKSYNPPCVFTAYATCPLPPRQNKHSLRIDAGELKYPSGQD